MWSLALTSDKRNCIQRRSILRTPRNQPSEPLPPHHPLPHQALKLKLKRKWFITTSLEQVSAICMKVHHKHPSHKCAQKYRILQGCELLSLYIGEGVELIWMAFRISCGDMSSPVSSQQEALLQMKKRVCFLNIQINTFMSLADFTKFLNVRGLQNSSSFMRLGNLYSTGLLSTPCNASKRTGSFPHILLVALHEVVRQPSVEI